MTNLDVLEGQQAVLNHSRGIHGGRGLLRRLGTTAHTQVLILVEHGLQLMIDILQLLVLDPAQ